MNIFYISTNAKQAAEWAVDKHVTKMVVETAQLLSTAHRILDGVEYVGKTKTGRNIKRWRLNDKRDDGIYQASHVSHPSNLWCRASSGNYNWLLDYFQTIMNEYTYRYDKQHKSESLLPYLNDLPHNIRVGGMTPMACAMGDEYIISDDPVENYRNYYRNGKSHLHKWTKRNKPEWI